MCDQTTTNICNQLAAQANELRIAEQHEATIAAALALPEAERMRLWVELGKEFAPPAYNAKELDRNAIYDRNRRIEFLQEKLAYSQHKTFGDRDRMKAELEKLKASI